MRIIGALVLGLGITGAASLVGQDARQPQVSRAFREFDPARRQRLLVNALNPASGPLRGTWPVGVQLLAQTLIEDGKDSAAAVWLRWAIRLSPDMQPDTVMFLPEVVAAYRSARTFVMRTRGPADSLVATTWVWPGSAVGGSMGRLEIAGSGAVSVSVDVGGGDTIVTGGGTSLRPRSYQLSAAAGPDRVQMTREVLPGVTTVLTFQLPLAPAKVVPQPVVSRPPGTKWVPPRRKRGFPVVWAGVGAAGAVGLVFLLTKGGSGDAGGIIVTFPSP